MGSLALAISAETLVIPAKFKWNGSSRPVEYLGTKGNTARFCQYDQNFSVPFVHFPSVLIASVCFKLREEYFALNGITQSHSCFW